jgi:PTH1 family peptidyl-tRNA hydrolase
VAGLGNPGRDYEASRHNFGFRAADALVRHYGGRWQAVANPPMDECLCRLGEGVMIRVVRPLAFMNRSGGPVQRALSSSGLNSSRLIVLVDDLALPLGTLRIREGGGDGGHNGLRSVAESLGNGGFTRIRLGIAPGDGMPSAGEWVDFVLGFFEPHEEEKVRQVAGVAVRAVTEIVNHGPSRAMSRFNGW